jgi:hypothetical protein
LIAIWPSDKLLACGRLLAVPLRKFWIGSTIALD